MGTTTSSATVQITQPLIAPSITALAPVLQVLADEGYLVNHINETTRRHCLGLLVTRTWTLKVSQ